ncbi:unnamed protein product [Penicillium pancosmium]
MERRGFEGYPSSQSQPRSHQNASQTTQRPLPSFLDRLPSSPPPLKLEAPGPGVRRLLDRWRRVEYRRRYASPVPSRSRKMSRRSSLSPCRSTVDEDLYEVEAGYWSDDRPKRNFKRHSRMRKHMMRQMEI